MTTKSLIFALYLLITTVAMMGGITAAFGLGPSRFVTWIGYRLVGIGALLTQFVAHAFYHLFACKHQF